MKSSGSPHIRSILRAAERPAAPSDGRANTCQQPDAECATNRKRRHPFDLRISPQSVRVTLWTINSHTLARKSVRTYAAQRREPHYTYIAYIVRNASTELRRPSNAANDPCMQANFPIENRKECDRLPPGFGNRSGSGHGKTRR